MQKAQIPSTQERSHLWDLADTIMKRQVSEGGKLHDQLNNSRILKESI